MTRKATLAWNFYRPWYEGRPLEHFTDRELLYLANFDAPLLQEFVSAGRKFAYMKVKVAWRKRSVVEGQLHAAIARSRQERLLCRPARRD